jgi:Fur family peroxide stress response transcriptional regulator
MTRQQGKRNRLDGRRAEDLVARFRDACREAGIRVTAQRLEVFRALAVAEDHPSAEAVLRRVRRRLPVVSLDTVYRTLALFEDKGLVRKVAMDGPGRYDARRPAHHHLVCRRCRKVCDLDWPDFDELGPAPTPTGWGEVERREAHLVGLCAACARKRRRKKQ